MENEAAGDRIGRYRLLDKLGEGGFGRVWRAAQDEPIQREVALKVVKPGMNSAEIAARFAAERQALAMMEHPNIAAVFEAGESEKGRPYFVMELVQGPPITDFCDQGKLTVRERLRLFIPVCQAIQHAHQKGILHRDLKPSNILVEQMDSGAVAKVIDFGIAKAIDRSVSPQFDITLARTVEGMVIGTPQYMSPEQAGREADVDTRSDIYALGTILHELLTGQPPLSRDYLKAAALQDILRMVREEEVKRPSSRLIPASEILDAIAERRNTTGKRLSDTVKGELDWIILKALEKDRKRRYESAAGLAEDLQRFLSGEPVLAGPPSRGYRLRKFLGRNKGSVFSALVIMLLLCGGVIVSTLQALRIERERKDAEAARWNEATHRERAEKAAAKSQQVATFMKELLNGMNPDTSGGRDVSVLRDIINNAKVRLIKDLANQPETQIELLNTLAHTLIRLTQYPDAEVLSHESLRLCRQQYGSDHAATADALSHLSVSCHGQGKRAEAEAAAREALAIKRRLYGEKDRRLTGSLWGLTDILHAQGRVQEAIATIGEAIEIARQSKNDSEVIRMGRVLAGMIMDLGRFDEAERLFVENIRQLDAAGHAADGNMDSALHGLALALLHQGKAAEAEPIARRAAAMRKTGYTEGHFAAVNAMNTHAIVLSKLQRMDEAEYVLREAVAMAHRIDRTSGRGESGFFLSRLVELLQNRKKYGDAESLLRDELAVLRQRNPQNPAALPPMADRLVNVLLAQEKHAEAEQFLGELLPRSLATDPGAKDLVLIRARFHLARARLEEAIADTDLVLKGSADKGSEQASIAAWILRSQAQQKSGDLSGTEKSLREAVKLARTALPDHSARRNEPLNLLIEFLQSQNRTDDIQALVTERDEVLARRKQRTASLVSEAQQTLVTPAATATSPPATNSPPVAAVVAGPVANQAARTGQFKEAIQHFPAAISIRTNDTLLMVQYATALVEADDRDGYIRFCTDRLEQLGKSEDTNLLGRLAQTCLIAPLPVAETKVASDIALKAMLGIKEPNALFWGELNVGLAAYRSNEFAKSIDLMSRVKPAQNFPWLTPLVGGITSAVQAMSYHRLGQPDKARAALAKAEEWVSSIWFNESRTDLGNYWHDAAIAHSLMREAQTLIHAP